jgi:hypothetical protein
MRWQKLQQEFMELVRKAEGPMKETCGMIIVSYGDYDDTGMRGATYVQFGGYCIGHWSRSERIGPFKTEDEAYEAAVKKVAEAKKLIDEGCQEDCCRE